jgi:hypothetical protein
MIDTAISFCRALDQWALGEGDLEQILARFNDHQITTPGEVQAVCRALDALHSNTDLIVALDKHPLALLTRYLRSPSNEEMRQRIILEVLPLLRWYVTDALASKPHNPQDVMKVLEVLALYHQKEDVSLIYKSILLPLGPQDPAWLSILATYRDQHPFLKPFVQALSKHPPSGRVGLTFLKLCDHLSTTKQYHPHGFNSEAGLAKLRSYLHPQSNRSPEFAVAAVQSAALLEENHRESLLSLANHHPNPSIIFLANVTRASLGDHVQQQALVDRCKDMMRSYETQLKLQEIGMETLIPEEAKQPEFLALAKTAHWLVADSPLHRAPDRLQLLESRELFWLPRHKHLRLYAVKYEFDEPVGNLGIKDGIAIVGGLTHSLIGETNSAMELADIYGLHCCWELEEMHDPLAPRQRTAKLGRNLLRKNNPDF